MKKNTASYGSPNQEMLDAQGLDSSAESVPGIFFDLEVFMKGRNSDRTTSRIDGTPMTAEPGPSLFCTFGKVGYTRKSFNLNSLFRFD